MLKRLELSCPADPVRLLAEAVRLRSTFPGLTVYTGDQDADAATEPAGGRIEVAARAWRAESFDPLVLDRAVANTLPRASSLTFRVHDQEGSARACVSTAAQVITRYQRLISGRNRFSQDPLFSRVLSVHKALHDLRKPLVAADFDHAIDTWQWVLRLAPDAGLAVQIAALFHDVERLVSESDQRVEQHAPDYLAFKLAHAAAGAAFTREALRATGATDELLDRVEALVREHEQPGRDPDKCLLNEADALSFFSLNACGFIGYYGLFHTKKKIAYTLARLGERGLAQLALIRHRADIAALVKEALGTRASAWLRAQTGSVHA